MKFTVKINAGVSRALHDAAADALADIMEDDLRESNEVTPIEEGTLIRSGFAELDRKNLTGQVARDTPYAVVQELDETLSHDAGRKSHALADTVEGNRRRHVDYLQDKIRGAV